MRFDRKTLFAGLKTALKPTGFNALQETAIAEIVSEFERRKLNDVRWLAYILATVWHEARFQSVREIGRGKGKKYGVPHAKSGRVYYGRGFVQLTWFDNYLKFERTLNLPLTADPDMALLVPVAVAILFEGMTTGVTAKDSFTKYQLHDFFNDKKDDAVGARRIINGTDKAKLIAEHHVKILAVVQKAKRDDVPTVKLPKGDAEFFPPETSAAPSGKAETAAGGAGAVVVSTGAAAAALGFPWERVLLMGGCALALIIIITVVLKFRSKPNGPK